MQQTYFFETTNKKPFIIDCGCNIGLSILYIKYLYPEASIVGFEPDQKTFELLQKNIAQNNLSNIEVHKKAISNYDGEIEFFKNENKEGSLMMGLHVSRGSEQSTKIACTSLNHFLDRQIDFLKMDIEGAEATCFQDIQSQNKFKNIKNIILECHHNIQEAPVLSEILPILEKNEFKYQISAILRAPYPKHQSQDVMIYAHKE